VTAVAPATVEEVIASLRAIADASRTDGVSAFARLYLDVTEGVNAELAGSAFLNPLFLTRLDVAFATLFLEALASYGTDPKRAPRAWVPLFESRSQRGIAPLQFALAGMNAHINRDLPVALISTCTALHVELRRDSPEHTDFERVNELLARVEAKVKAAYVTGWVAAISRLVHGFHRLDDVLAMWNVERARDAAWTNSETLWSLRDSAELSADFLLTLDRMVGFAGRGLLVPTESWLGRLARRLARSGHGT
jgi:hypothetical protein